MTKFWRRVCLAVRRPDEQLRRVMVQHTARSSIRVNLLSAGLIPIILWFLHDAGLGWRLPAWAGLAVLALFTFDFGIRWCLRMASAGIWSPASGIVFGGCFVLSGVSWGGLAVLAMPGPGHPDQQAVICCVAMTALAVNLVLASAVNGAFALFHVVTAGLSTIGFLVQGNDSLAGLIAFAAVAVLPLRAELASHIAEASTLAHRNHDLLQALRRERAEAEQANLRLTEANIELSRRATRDGLTGLANRQLFTEHLAESLIRARHTNRLVSVLYLDVDRFKSINDTYGHASGDEVLRTVASRVIGKLGPHLLARLGGDEFTAIVVTETEAEALELAERVRSCFDRPIAVGDQSLPTTLSVGVATDPGEVTPDELLDLADAALYRAKQRGRNQVQGSAVRSVA